MKNKTAFAYTPTDFETEKASNSYLMSLLALIAGLPLPIINLIATLIFFLLHKRSTYFIKWHCTQALLSQLSVFVINTIGFWWTISILFGTPTLSNAYFAYIICMFLFNLIELAGTIYTAIETRKGNHIEWWFYGPLTHLICKP
jgi:uncharacterized Tic20 family protein